MDLNCYKEYSEVNYDYIEKLPSNWKLVPNIALFQERIERGFPEETLLSVTIGKGIIKQEDINKKDSSTSDKSKYKLVLPKDLAYSIRFRQGAVGYSTMRGIVSPACVILKVKKNVEINPRFFYYQFKTEFYKNYAERYSYGIADGQIPLRYKDFKRMYSIFPPISTQNEIVQFLDNRVNSINKIMEIEQSLVGKTWKNAGLLEEYKQRLISDCILGRVNVSKLFNIDNILV
ncbi:restriction endonuclease subunit S [Yeosuana sp.]|uniref:restriction endonuclease subunit S n=1 Tax=Yeosuana sp. TaxID=2529388 RepID=UPI004054FFE2